MRSPHRIARTATGLALFCSATVCRAEGGLPTQLDFQGAADCPNEASFVERVNARTPIVLVGESAALRLQVTLVSSPGHARGVLGTGAVGSRDTREVTATTCAEVTDALALIAALLVERTKRERPAPAAQPVPAAKLALPLRAPAPPPMPRPRRVMLGAEATLSKPVTSATLTGAGVSLLVEASLSWWLSVTYARSDVLTAARHARFAVGGATAGVGPKTLSLGPRIELAGALAGQGAFIEAQGVGVDVATSVRRSEWSLGLLSQLNMEVASGAVMFLQAGVFAPLIKRRFSTLSPDTVVGQSAVVSPQLGLGLSLAL